MKEILPDMGVSQTGGERFFIERRRRKRCPKCQFFTAISLILISSLAVTFLFDLLPSLMNKGDFQVSSASSFERKNNIVIDADLKMSFPDDVVEALENGIPIPIAVEVQVLRERFWWRNIIIKESRQLFDLRYHPLTNVHEVKNSATDERYTFNSRQDAMAVLGTIRGAHLIEKKELSKNSQYYVQMRILLDISRLPPALRQIASLSSSWRLESLWFRWKISDMPGSETRTAEVEPADLSVALKRKSKEQRLSQAQAKPEVQKESPKQSQDEILNNTSDKPVKESAK